MSKLQELKTSIAECAQKIGRNDAVELLAVTKGQSFERVVELIHEGHKLFGENKIQEAKSKWITLKQQYPLIQLHLIGHLQTNKVKEAVQLFDVIETLDSFKLAEKLVSEEKKQNKKLSYFIEINIGEEPQKTGIWPVNFADFYLKLKEYYPLNIVGLMCIPPIDKNPKPFFQQLESLASEFNLPAISMGMSDDYQQAIECGATLVRIGRALF